MIYLDNSATTKQDPQVTEVMLQCMEENFGNPSSLHGLGLGAEKAMKEARRQVLAAMGRSTGQLYFTSGGTESDNMAIFGAAGAGKGRGKKIVTSQVEHPALLEACKSLEQQGFGVTYVGVDEEGRLDMAHLKEAIEEDTILISIMQVNNETGAIMPLDEIAKLKQRALFHTDAVQAFGKMPLSEQADMITISGHKIHGPKGTGALYAKAGTHLTPFLVGGGQEGKMRSGTENVPAIVGLGKAATLMHPMTAEIKEYLWKGIAETIPHVRRNSPSDGSPAILNVSFLGTRGEVILHTLEQDEIYVSTCAACASGKAGGSHVLRAMGRTDQEIASALRFSFSEKNTIQEMDVLLDKLGQAVARFRKLGSFR